MRSRRAPIALVLVPLVVAACIGGPPHAGLIWLRNEGSQPVDVALDVPSSGLFGGTNHLSFQVAPWRKGWCYAYNEGVNPGSVTIAVSGPAMAFPMSTTVTVPRSPDTDIGVLIDSADEVHFSKAAPPPDDGPCQNYGSTLPTPSS